jgi:hypothetical protein
MPTTSQQLDDFAAMCEDAVVWTADLQGQLMDLIREPAMTLLGQTIPQNDRTKAMDNIYRCKPKGWIRAEQELAPKTAGGPSQGAVASFMLWDQPAGQAYLGLSGNHEIGIRKACSTLAVAMLAATARVWAQILREAGR